MPWRRVSPGHLDAWVGVFEEMLQAGADPDAGCILDPKVVRQTVGYGSDAQDVPSRVIKHFHGICWSPDKREEDPGLRHRFRGQHTIDHVINSVFDKNGRDPARPQTILDAALRRKNPDVKPFEMDSNPSQAHAKRKSRDATDDLVIRKRQRASYLGIG